MVTHCLLLDFGQTNAVNTLYRWVGWVVGGDRPRLLNQRVVTGQRMLQAASDIFLGWTRDDEGHDYYFRHLRDMKMTMDLEGMPKQDWIEYIELCGRF